MANPLRSGIVSMSQTMTLLPMWHIEQAGPQKSIRAEPDMFRTPPNDPHCAPLYLFRNSERCGMSNARMIALLAVALTLAPHNNSVLAETQPCRPMEYERNPYTICEVDLRKHMLRLYWKNSDGTPYAYLSSLPRALRGGGRLLFATNAGMFDPALKPVGLYVEQGRELVHVNTTSGYGNFHMKPNGVFYVSGDRAAVV